MCTWNKVWYSVYISDDIYSIIYMVALELFFHIYLCLHDVMTQLMETQYLVSCVRLCISIYVRMRTHTDIHGRTQLTGIYTLIILDFCSKDEVFF